GRDQGQVQGRRAVAGRDGVWSADVGGDRILEPLDARALGEPAREDRLSGGPSLLGTRAGACDRDHDRAPSGVALSERLHSTSRSSPTSRLTDARKPIRSAACSTAAWRRLTGFTLRTGSWTGCMPV